jgi:hypothetical protein
MARISDCTRPGARSLRRSAEEEEGEGAEAREGIGKGAWKSALSWYRIGGPWIVGAKSLAGAKRLSWSGEAGLGVR